MTNQPLTAVIVDFVPRVFDKDACRHANGTVKLVAGRIEYTECYDCGEKVYS